MFSPLITRTISTPHQSGRIAGSRIDSVILHHAASASLENTLATVAGTARQVSYNYVIGNAGEIVGAVGEQNRSWSVANAAWDSRAITICHVNERVGDPWPVSAAAHEASARLVADLHTRLGIPLTRTRILGDRQIRATACPGGLNMDAVVARAVQLLGTDIITRAKGLNMRSALCKIEPGVEQFILFTPGTPYRLRWQDLTGAPIAAGFLRQLEIPGDAVPITESMAEEIVTAADRMLPAA